MPLWQKVASFLTVLKTRLDANLRLWSSKRFRAPLTLSAPPSPTRSSLYSVDYSVDTNSGSYNLAWERVPPCCTPAKSPDPHASPQVCETLRDLPLNVTLLVASHLDDDTPLYALGIPVLRAGTITSIQLATAFMEAAKNPRSTGMFVAVCVLVVCFYFRIFSTRPAGFGRIVTGVERRHQVPAPKSIRHRRAANSKVPCTIPKAVNAVPVQVPVPRTVVRRPCKTSQLHRGWVVVYPDFAAEAAAMEQPPYAMVDTSSDSSVATLFGQDEAPVKCDIVVPDAACTSRLSTPAAPFNYRSPALRMRLGMEPLKAVDYAYDWQNMAMPPQSMNTKPFHVRSRSATQSDNWRSRRPSSSSDSPPTSATSTWSSTSFSTLHTSDTSDTIATNTSDSLRFPSFISTAASNPYLPSPSDTSDAGPLFDWHHPPTPRSPATRIPSLARRSSTSQFPSFGPAKADQPPFLIRYSHYDALYPGLKEKERQRKMMLSQIPLPMHGS